MLDFAQNNMANSILVTDTTRNVMFFETTPFETTPHTSPKYYMIVYSIVYDMIL